MRLALLADDWRDLLFPGLGNERFADAFAQTITFALLLARVDGIDLLGESYYEIAQKLGKRHLLMGQAFAVLTSGGEDELDTIETLRRVIDVADVRISGPSLRLDRMCASTPESGTTPERDLRRSTDQHQ